jgi:hypothetical protein
MVWCHTPKVLIRGLIGESKNGPLFSAHQVLFTMKIFQDDEISPNALALATAWVRLLTPSFP